MRHGCYVAGKSPPSLSLLFGHTLTHADCACISRGALAMADLEAAHVVRMLRDAGIEDEPCSAPSTAQALVQG